jgi:hypothetical protein
LKIGNISDIYYIFNATGYIYIYIYIYRERERERDPVMYDPKGIDPKSGLL